MAEHEEPQSAEGEHEHREPAPSDTVEELMGRVNRLLGVDPEITEERSLKFGDFREKGGEYFFHIGEISGEDAYPPGLEVIIDEMPIKTIEEGTAEQPGHYRVTRYFISRLGDKWRVEKASALVFLGSDPYVSKGELLDQQTFGGSTVTEQEVDQLQFWITQLEPIDPDEVPFYSQDPGSPE